LLQRLETVRESDIFQHSDYQRLLDENARVKEKLRKVQRKCDSMLTVIRERGYRGTDFGYRPYLSPQPRARPVSPDVLQSFGTHVKELTGLTRKIKRNYNARRSCRDASDDLDS
jgi:hypothetical protein